MRFRALGAVAALILVSTAFATIVFTRVQARGYATGSLNRRLDFQLNLIHRTNGANHRYFGNGSFAWRANNVGNSVRIHRVESLTLTEEDDAVVITITGQGVLGQFGFPPPSGRRGAPQIGDFTVTIVDNGEGSDTIEFSFQFGTGINAFTYHFSGTVQAGTLNWNQWTYHLD